MWPPSVFVHVDPPQRALVFERPATGHSSPAAGVTYNPLAMRIEPLRHHLGLVGEIANTLNQSWGDLPPWSTTDKIRERLLAGTGDADFPLVLVALGESGTLRPRAL